MTSSFQLLKRVLPLFLIFIICWRIDEHSDYWGQPYIWDCPRVHHDLPSSMAHFGVLQNISKWAKNLISMLTRVHGSRIIQKFRFIKVFWIWGTNRHVTKQRVLMYIAFKIFKSLVNFCKFNVKMFSTCHNCQYCHYCHYWVLSQVEFLSLVMIWVFEFCHNLCFWVLSQCELLNFVTIIFSSVLSQFELLSFVYNWVFNFVFVWVFEFGHNLSF